MTGVGIALPTNRQRLDGPTLRHITARLEGTACDSLWVNDHLAAFPAGTEHYPYHSSGRIDWDPGYPQYEALSACAYVAGITDRMRVGTSVLIFPQRHPVEVAKMVATLSDLSSGRFVLGVGVGWSRREMALLGWNPATRGSRLDEQIDFLRASWHPHATPPTPRYFEFPPDLILEPVPLPGQAPLILIGGTSAAALSRVRTRGDGWLAVSSPDTQRLASLGRALSALRSATNRELHAVVKVGLETPDHRQAIRIIDVIARHSWDEISFEFGSWDLDDACGLVNACVARLGECSRE
jgi:probable F420-dependent oxidoreductase